MLIYYITLKSIEHYKNIKNFLQVENIVNKHLITNALIVK